MRKGTDKERDAELIKRLQEEAPEVLKARVDFDSLIDKLVVSDDCLPPEAQPTKSRKRHKYA
jgi:hypothetical protein